MTPEKEKEVETKVILEFMRHGEKDPNKVEPIKSDEEVRLTERGRGMAQEKGEGLKPQPEVSLAWGSPKERTHETALHAMLPEMDVNASLEEMLNKIKKEQPVGGKIKVADELSFSLAGPEGKEMLDAFKQGKYLQYLVESSDQRAIDLGDTVSSTYTRYAGNIASILKRYSEVGNNFNRIASKKDDYEKYGNQLERYLASHQGVVEGFVAKVLEEKFGKEERDEFINSLGGGFKETEGIHVEIVNTGSKQSIEMLFKVGNTFKSIEIEKDLLDKIIKEREDFEFDIEIERIKNAIIDSKNTELVMEMESLGWEVGRTDFDGYISLSYKKDGEVNYPKDVIKKRFRDGYLLELAK